MSRGAESKTRPVGEWWDIKSPQVVKLVDAVVDILEVHVHVGPGEVRGTRGGDVGGWGFLRMGGARCVSGKYPPKKVKESEERRW